MEKKTTKSNKELKKELIDLVLKKSGLTKKEILNSAIDRFISLNGERYLTKKEKEYFKSVFICYE